MAESSRNGEDGKNGSISNSEIGKNGENGGIGRKISSANPAKYANNVKRANAATTFARS